MRELDEMPLEEIEKEEEQKGVFGRQDYRLVQFILGNDEVEHELKMFLVKHLWAFKDREMALTNFDNLDVQRERLMFHDAVLSFLMSRPHYQFNFSDEMAITNYEALVFAKLKRSTGGRDRERFILGAQIQQKIGESEEKPSGGILQKAGKWLGMG